MIRPSASPSPAGGEVGGRRQGVIALVAKDRPAQGGAGAGLGDGATRVIHEKVLVGDGGHAALNHLRQRQEHAPIDIFLFKIILEGPHIFVEPLFDGDVFRRDHGR